MENVASLKQGALMLFDNQRAQWSRMYSVLTADGCSLHSTCGGGSSVSRPNRPLIRPADIVSLYRANADDETLPQLHYVVFGLELKDREILLLRTAEPKGTKEWTKALESLMGSSAATAVKTIDDLRAFRSFFTPQLYSQLFRGRPDVTVKIALTAHSNKVPAAPTSVKAMPRRSSLSAQTPSRNGTLPLRRPPLIPIVAATFRVDPVPAAAPAVEPPAAPAPIVEAKAETASPTASPKRVLGARDRNASPSSPKQKATAAVVPAAEEQLSSSPTGKKLQMEGAPMPAIDTVAQAEVMKNEPVESVEESSIRAIGGEEPLSEVSPRKTMEKLHRLKQAANQHSQLTDEVVANLRKQVESLTRRNIDLQVCDLNNQQRIFELEGLLHESESEVDRLKSRVSMFQRQLEVKEATFEERLREEKAELMETLKEEVQQQWAAMRKVFEEKEAQYKQEIERLTISAMGF